MIGFVKNTHFFVLVFLLLTIPLVAFFLRFRQEIRKKAEVTVQWTPEPVFSDEFTFEDPPDTAYPNSDRPCSPLTQRGFRFNCDPRNASFLENTIIREEGTFLRISDDGGPKNDLGYIWASIPQIMPNYCSNSQACSPFALVTELNFYSPFKDYSPQFVLKDDLEHFYVFLTLNKNAEEKLVFRFFAFKGPGPFDYNKAEIVQDDDQKTEDWFFSSHVVRVERNLSDTEATRRIYLDGEEIIADTPPFSTWPAFWALGNLLKNPNFSPEDRESQQEGASPRNWTVLTSDWINIYSGGETISPTPTLTPTPTLSLTPTLTPTPTVFGTPTPTPTIPAGATTLKIKLAFQGRPENKNEGKVYLFSRPKDDQRRKPQSPWKMEDIKIDSPGWSITQIVFDPPSLTQASSWEFLVRGGFQNDIQTLRKRYKDAGSRSYFVINKGIENRLDFGILKAGDLFGEVSLEPDEHRDNEVNRHDYNILSSEWVATWNSRRYSPADFNLDQVVNRHDYTVLAGNWGEMVKGDD